MPLVPASLEDTYLGPGGVEGGWRMTMDRGRWEEDYCKSDPYLTTENRYYERK